MATNTKPMQEIIHIWFQIVLKATLKLAPLFNQMTHLHRVNSLVDWRALEGRVDDVGQGEECSDKQGHTSRGGFNGDDVGSPAYHDKEA